MMEKGTQALPPTIPMGLHFDMPIQMGPRRKPRHLALVLQGHRQWALSTGLPYTQVVGAAAGRLLELIDLCATRALDRVTIHLFTDDICRLPPGGNAELVRIFMRYIAAGAQNMHRNNVGLVVEGSLGGLDALTRGLLTDVAKRTRWNTGMQLTVVIDSPRTGKQQRANVGERTLSPNLWSSEAVEPIELYVEPDFVIRTGGSLPVHRAMLWNTQRTSLYFTDALWPNFDAQGLRDALDWYSSPTREAGIQLSTTDCTTVQ
jgi:undecaprenyl diphosphate synthase